MKAKGTIKHQKFTKGGKSYAKNSNTRPSILATSRGVLLKIHASICLLGSITWIPIQILNNDGHLKITQPQVLSYWAWAACDFTPTAGRLTPARRWPWYHGFSTPTMFEHSRPWFDRGVWPWCVISSWQWYIANNNGNKVNYCFLLSQWKHITAHNNFIFSN